MIKYILYITLIKKYEWYVKLIVRIKTIKSAFKNIPSRLACV